MSATLKMVESTPDDPCKRKSGCNFDRTPLGIRDEIKDKDMVSLLLDLKDQLDTIWEEIFLKNEVFSNTIKDSFEHLIDLRKNKPIEHIAKFLDEKL